MRINIIMTDFQRVISFEALYNAYKIAKRGKGNKISSAKFNINVLDEIHKLHKSLNDRTYAVSHYTEFYVYEPKERLIKAGSFRDAIVQHSICDNVLLPLFQNEFIIDNYAGQIGKGTLFGLNRLSEFFASFFRAHGTTGYILKCDITKFFYSIDHEILKDTVHYHIQDKEIQWLCDQFIDSTEELGLPLGNQISQVFALLYLNGLDHFIKDELGAQYYGRYMDDFYIIHEDREYLVWCLSYIEKFVKSLGLSLNSKTQIIPFRNGLKFLGFHTYISQDGEVFRKVKNENKRNAQRKYTKMAKLVRDGKISKAKFSESYNSWKGHAMQGGCCELVKKIDSHIEAIIPI